MRLGNMSGSELKTILRGNPGYQTSKMSTVYIFCFNHLHARSKKEKIHIKSCMYPRLDKY